MDWAGTDYTHAQYGELLLELLRLGFYRPRAFFRQLYNVWAASIGWALLAKLLPFDGFRNAPVSRRRCRLSGCLLLGALHGAWAGRSLDC